MQLIAMIFFSASRDAVCLQLIASLCCQPAVTLCVCSLWPRFAFGQLSRFLFAGCWQFFFSASCHAFCLQRVAMSCFQPAVTLFVCSLLPCFACGQLMTQDSPKMAQHSPNLAPNKPKTGAARSSQEQPGAGKRKSNHIVFSQLSRSLFTLMPALWLG